MPTVIVSYRRSDTQWIVGRIVDRLERDLGKGEVFMDIDAIPFGMDFREHLRNVLDQCDVLIAVIGPNWLAANEAGRPRIFEPTDWVRIEIETALTLGKPVVPVLIDRAPIPKVSELPKSMRAFAFRQAADIDTGRDFHVHMDRLVRAIAQYAAASRPIAGSAPAAGLAPEVDQTSDLPPEEAIPERAAEMVTAQEKAVHHQAITQARRFLRVSISAIAIGVGLWVLSHLDWLPWGLSEILAGPEDKVSNRIGWLFIAALGFGGAILSYLDLRALRLGTERARKQAFAANVVAKWLGIAGVALVVGVFLLLLGLVIYHWLTSDGRQFPFFIVSYFVHVPVLFATLAAIPWLEERIRPAELIFAAIAFGALLVGDVALGVFGTWAVAQDELRPWWLAFFHALPNVLVAPFLVWGLVTALWRLRKLTKQRPN